MRNCQRRAMLAVVRDCDTELFAVNAKEKAIACLSMDVRSRCNSKVRSDRNARVQCRTLSSHAERLAACRSATARRL